MKSNFFDGMTIKMTGRRHLSLALLVFAIFISLYATAHAYDSNNDGRVDFTDVIGALQEAQLLEVVHSLQILSGMAPSPELYFSRSGNGHLVTDLSRDLIWQDYALIFGDENAGIDYCSQSELDTYDDWRLPTFQELQDFFKAVDADNSFDLNYWGTFSGCTAAVAIGGYVRTPRGAEVYGGEVGDRINFGGGAAVRCVRDIPGS